MKPARAGIYTATGGLARWGMWYAYLLVNEGSSLFPLPWRVWHLLPDSAVRVFEVASAAAWLDLVARYPLRVGETIFPDWRSIGRDYDAVHLTLAAVVATQGIAFGGVGGTVAPPYWDVESTVWLRWCFREVTEVG